MICICKVIKFPQSLDPNTATWSEFTLKKQGSLIESHFILPCSMPKPTLSNWKPYKPLKLGANNKYPNPQNNDCETRKRKSLYGGMRPELETTLATLQRITKIRFTTESPIRRLCFHSLAEWQPWRDGWTSQRQKVDRRWVDDTQKLTGE